MSRSRLLLSTLALASVAASPAAQANVSHTFDADNQGWLISDIVAAPGAGNPANWNAGRLTTGDVEAWVTFSAPAAFLGNLSGYAGGTFGFDLQDEFKDSDADIFATFGILGTNGDVMYWFGGSPATGSMTSFLATLGTSDSRWRFNGNPGDISAGSAPDAAQWAAMLAGVAAIRINADWRTGSDLSHLDNVALSGVVPEPGTYALMALGLAAIGTVARRRRG